MKKNYFIWLLMLGLVTSMACQTATNTEPEVDPNWVSFEQNAKTLGEYLDAWQNENVDYDKFYAKDYAAWGTGFGELDTMRFEDVKKWDQFMFAAYDFKISDGPVNFLPGVDIENKKIDGSVRFYATWDITKVATDSTEARSAKLQMYHAYQFNDEGKIFWDISYGDFGGLMNHLNAKEE